MLLCLARRERKLGRGGGCSWDRPSCHEGPRGTGVLRKSSEALNWRTRTCQPPSLAGTSVLLLHAGRRCQPKVTVFRSVCELSAEREPGVRLVLGDARRDGSQELPA